MSSLDNPEQSSKGAPRPDCSQSAAPRADTPPQVSYALLAIILCVMLTEFFGGRFAPVENVGLNPVRGIIASLVVIGTIMIAALRRKGTPFLPLSPGARAAMEVHLVDWFVWMRAIACATATVLILMTVDVVGLLSGETFLPLLVCVASLATANILFELSLRRFPSKVSAQIWGQVICDLAILSLMLHYSGGIENPLSLLFLFHVIISGILFSRFRCYLVGLIAFLFFTTLVAVEYMEWAPHYTLEIFPHEGGEEPHHAAHYRLYIYSSILLQALLLLTTAYFITTIMERLRSRERESIELAKRETEARERLESVVDAAGIGLRLLDHQLHPVWTNTRFLEWATGGEPAKSNARKTLADGLSRVAEHELSGEDESKHFYRTTTAAMNRAGGDADQVVQLIQDITAQKIAESELLFAGKLAAVGELAGNISHEINNPLGILSARLHLLLSRHADELSDVASREVHKMTEMADRITTITRALLDYCRPGASERSPIPAGLVVQHAAKIMGARMDDPDISIDMQIAPNLPLLNASAEELEQVLVNLLMNAADVSPPGSTVTVEVNAIPGGSRGPAVRIVVQDSGPGIPESVQERIFEPFFTTKKAGKGTGLGLSICHRIITSHGGTISMENTPGSGARFQIELPAIQD